MTAFTIDPDVVVLAYRALGWRPGARGYSNGNPYHTVPCVCPAAVLCAFLEPELADAIANNVPGPGAMPGEGVGREVRQWFIGFIVEALSQGVLLVDDDRPALTLSGDGEQRQAAIMWFDGFTIGFDGYGSASAIRADAARIGTRWPFFEQGWKNGRAVFAAVIRDIGPPTVIEPEPDPLDFINSEF